MKFNPETQINYLKPAEFFFLKKPGIIRTVLGSCVSITMYSKRKKIGSACHPILPTCRDNKVCYFAVCKMKYKYVDCVITEMVRLFKREGVALEELEVKLFGGSEMISKHTNTPTIIRVGNKNVEMARKKLQGLGIKILSEDTGGAQSRRLFFDTSTGDVWIKKLTRDSARLFEKNDVQEELLMQRDI